MAITRLGGANAISGTLPAANINSTSLGNVDVGKVLQVVSAFKNDNFSTTSTSFTDITDLTLNITPTSSSNKILILGHAAVSCSLDDRNANLKIRKVIGATTTDVGVAETVGSTIATSAGGHLPYVSGGQNVATYNIAFQYLDSPNTTNQITYKLSVQVISGTTVHIGRSADFNSTDSNRSTFPSAISVMEVSA